MAARKKSDGGKKSASKPPAKSRKGAPAKKSRAKASSDAPLAAGAGPGAAYARDNGDNSFTVVAEGGEGLEQAFRVDAPPASSDPRTLVVDPPGPGSVTVVCRPIKEGKAEVTVCLAPVDPAGPGPYVLTVSAEVTAADDGSLKAAFPGSSIKG